MQENKKTFNWNNVITLGTLLLSIITFALVVTGITMYQVDQARQAGTSQQYQEFIAEHRDEVLSLTCDDYDSHTVFTWASPVDAEAYEISYHTKLGNSVTAEEVFETTAETYSHVFDSSKEDMVFNVKAIKADGTKSLIGAEAIVEDTETTRCGV